MLGSGGDWRRFVQEKTVEGVVACGSIKELAASSDLSLPLLDTVDAVLSERAQAAEAMGEFFKGFRYG